MNYENSAKAIIIENSKVLLLKNKSLFNVGEWYCLPGGRQHFGETLEAALKRECMEEIGVIPEKEKLLFVREYIHDNHELREHGKNHHKLEFMFLCRVNSNLDKFKGIEEDETQIGIEWVDISEVKNLNIFPSKLKSLEELLSLESPVYWGDIL